MKTPDGLVGANGKPAKIEVLVKGGEKALREFPSKDGALAVGNTVKCYVLTAPGDIISIDITAGAHIADVFDLEVDGILRASLTSKALSKPFHGTINKVCFKAKSGKKGGDGAKYCGMKIKSRDASMDATFDRNGTTSPVSRLIIKAWHKNPTPDTMKEATAVQFFSWEEYTSWKELKHCIKETPKPPFEIDFIDSTKLSKKQKEKMDEIPKRNYGQYSLVTTFIFELQSTSNLSTLGFEDIPIYIPKPPAAKPPRVKKGPKAKKSQAEVEDEDDDAGTSTVAGLEESKKDGNIASLSDSDDEGRWVPKSKASKSHAEPKPAKTTKSTASLTPFPPPPTAEDILKSIMPYKPASPPSKEDVSKSLSFSRANLFSSESVTGIQNSSNKSIKEIVSPSALNMATEEAKAGAPPIYSPAPTKGLVLHGEVGAPARRAFLARGEAQETESQSTSESQVDDLLDTVTETIKLPFENNFTAINHKKTNTGMCHPAKPASPLYESPEFEPLTPPVSNKKPLPGRDYFMSGDRPLESPSQSFLFSRSIEVQKSIPSSQATASTQDPAHSGTATQDVEVPVDLDKVVEGLEAMSRRSATQRAASPALSEATEVADPMEVMESVRNSQRDIIPSNSDLQREITDYYRNVSTEKSSIPEIPILGPQKAVEEPRFSDVKSGHVRDQVRESWLQKSPTPSTSSRSRQIEKRKADAIEGRESLEGGHLTKVQKTAGLEQKKMAAQAKLAAATERNLRLEKERRAALEIKKQNDEVEALLRKAEEMEQNNDELEAEINALNESNFI